MWCPICDVVELERPLLKKTYEEIEKLFDEILGGDKAEQMFKAFGYERKKSPFPDWI